jgi:hypothetical protein
MSADLMAQKEEGIPIQIDRKTSRQTDKRKAIQTDKHTDSGYIWHDYTSRYNWSYIISSSVAMVASQRPPRRTSHRFE